jgi:O-antigen/teichoic acid export membrane protein
MSPVLSPVSRTIAALVSATALSQLFALAILPLLARRLGPAEMGYWGTFIAIVSVLAPVAAFALPQAMVVADSGQKARQLARLSALLLLGFVLLLLGGYFLFYWLTPELLPLYLSPVMLFYLIPALVSAVAVQLVQQWSIRQQQFTIWAKAEVYQAVLLNGSKLVIVLLWPVASALMLLQAVLPFFQFIRLKGWLLFAEHPDKRPVFPSANTGITNKSSQAKWREFRTLLKEFKDFPLYQSPQQLLNAAAQALPVFILASAFGVAAAGFYTLAKTVLLAPASWVNKAIADYLYPSFSALQRRQLALSPLFIRSTLGLAVFAVVPVSLLFYLAPWLFSVIFGEQWLAAAQMAQWLCPWLYCFLVNPPAVKLLMVLRLQSAALLLNGITLLGRGFVLWYCAFYLQDITWAILSFSWVGVVHNVLFIALAYWGCRRADLLLFKAGSQG